jgi:hypothetical protein
VNVTSTRLVPIPKVGELAPEDSGLFRCTRRVAGLVMPGLGWTGVDEGSSSVAVLLVATESGSRTPTTRCSVSLSH